MATIGIDEVGRGCLAGPVCMTGVKLSTNYPQLTHTFGPKHVFWKTNNDLKLVKDSKKLSLKNREKILEIVEKNKIDYVYISASNKLIDKFGIGVCLSHITIMIAQYWDFVENTNIIIDGKIKMLEQLDSELVKLILSENLELNKNLDDINLSFIAEQNPNMCLFEKSTRFDISILRENKADDKYLAVALASNIAKVKRDNFMKNLSKDFPEYGWDTNVGYGTEKHRKAIAINSNNPYIRTTWIHF